MGLSPLIEGITLNQVSTLVNKSLKIKLFRKRVDSFTIITKRKTNLGSENSIKLLISNVILAKTLKMPVEFVQNRSTLATFTGNRKKRPINLISKMNQL